MSIMKQKVEEVRGRIGRKEMTQEEGMNELQAFAMQLNPKAAEMFGSSIMSQQGAMQAEAAQQVQAPNPAQAGGIGDPRFAPMRNTRAAGGQADPKSFVANMGFTPPSGGQSSANNMFDQLNQEPNVSSQTSYTNTGPRQGPEAIFNKMGQAQNGGQVGGLNPQDINRYPGLATSMQDRLAMDADRSDTRWVDKQIAAENAQAQQSVMSGNTPISPQGSIPEAQFVEQPYQPLGPNPQAQNGSPEQRYTQDELDAMQNQHSRQAIIDKQGRSVPVATREQEQNQKELEQQPGIFSRIGSGLQSAGQGMGNYAEKLFNDPNRMAMLQGGLSMMNPNSYYDKQGFGSVFQGLQAGLGQAQSGMKGVMDRKKAVSDRALVDAKALHAGNGGDEGEYRAMVTEFLKLPDGDPRKPLLGRRIQQLAPKAENGDFMSKAMEKQSAKYIHEGGTDADATQSSLRNYINILDTTVDAPDGIITGPGTEGILWLGRFLSENMGMQLTGDNALNNTTRYIAGMGTMVGEIIKQFGSGTGLSDADREFARMISAQDPTGFTQESIKGVLALNEMRMRSDLLEHNDRVKQLSKTSRGATPAYLTKRIPRMSENLRNHIKNRMAGKSILGEKGGFGSMNDAGELEQKKPVGWVDRTENEWENMVKAQKKASSGGFEGFKIKSVRSK